MFCIFLKTTSGKIRCNNEKFFYLFYSESIFMAGDTCKCATSALLIYNLKVCVTAQEMRVGPSEPAYRSRLQTTSSCCGQKPWW
jgi:hypothetical protein